MILSTTARWLFRWLIGCAMLIAACWLPLVPTVREGPCPPAAAQHLTAPAPFLIRT